MAGLRTSFVHKYLEPATRLGEVLIGLIVSRATS